MNISKIKVGSTTYNLKDSNAISLNTISSWAQAGNSDTIPSSKLPSYVDDVLEYASTSSFPETGESGKIYVATDTNKIYRWGGSSYVVISETLAVGTTEGTAYDGAAGAALKSKLDTIESGAQTHRAPSAAEVKTALGTGSGTTKYLREDGTWQTPPDNNTTYSEATTSAAGLMSASDKTKLNGIASGATANVGTVTGVTVGSGGTNYTPTNGVVTIPAYPSVPTKVSQLTNDSGYITSYTNTVTSINGKTGAIAASDIATVLTGAGYKLTDTDTNTWRPVLCNGTDIGSNTLNLKPGTNVSLSNSNGAITITATDTNTWRPVGTGATDAAAGNHTHATSIATSTGTNQITLAHGGKYAITAGGTSYVFTMPSDNNTTYSAGTGLSLSGTTFALATSGVTAGTYKRVTVDAYGRVTSGDNTDADSWRTVQCNGTSIGSNTLNLKAGTNVSLSNSNGTITISSTDTNTWPTKTSQLTNDSGFLTSNAVTSVAGNTGAVTAAQIGTALTNAGYKLTDNNTTYNFSGTSFTSNNSTAVNANDVAYNAHTYYTSNGPATSIGASTNDGALYSQAYSTSWVGQIAQDYRNGGLYVRGKNNGTWLSWYRVWDSRSLTNLNQLSNGPGYITGITKAMVTNALGYTPPTTNTTYSGSSTVTLSGTTFSLTKANVTTALGYTPPTSDTNTTYSAGTGLSLSGTTFSLALTKALVTTALGYTPPTSDTNTWRPLGTGANDACAGNDSRLSNSRPASDVYSWAKASSKPSYGYGEISHAVNSVTTSGAISLAGTTPLHIVTLNGNASSVALSSNPATGHSCHVIFFSTAARTVTIAHNATARVCPGAADVTLNVPANGYVEVDFLFDGTKTWVRGV